MLGFRSPGPSAPARPRLHAAIERQRNRIGNRCNDGYESVSIIRIEANTTVQQIKIIVEKHPDSYIAYPLGMKGIVVGEGENYKEALTDVKSAIQFHFETFGKDIFEGEASVLEAFVAEAGVAI